MTLDKLKMNLSQYGNIQVCKEGHVFTLLITGENLSNWGIVNEIQMQVIEYTGDTYPIIEVIKNSEKFFCLVLRGNL